MPNLLSGVLGGLVVLVLGAILIATDVIDTGDTTREVVPQAPLTRPASDSMPGDEGLTVQEIYDRDGPGVVFIQADVRSQVRVAVRPARRGSGIATGSGFVLDKDGYILTNAHVVEGAREVGVRFTEESSLVEAKVVGTDLSTDLAVLKVDPDDAPKLTPAEARRLDASCVSAIPVIAIGNPFGYDRTVTTGIVSALQRQISGAQQLPDRQRHPDGRVDQPRQLRRAADRRARRGRRDQLADRDGRLERLGRDRLRGPGQHRQADRAAAQGGRRGRARLPRRHHRHGHRAARRGAQPARSTRAH